MARSRRKNFAYFFNLEKNEPNLKKIPLCILMTLLYQMTKEFQILFQTFTQKLYTSSFNPDSCDLFINKMQTFTPSISINNKNLCEEMSLKELDIIKKNTF